MTVLFKQKTGLYFSSPGKGVPLVDWGVSAFAFTTAKR